jgi:small subunit ribosomal protein S1
MIRMPCGVEMLTCATLFAVNTVIDTPTAKVVEGSDGLLLEIDGQIVPNYDATLRPFEEGEVVTGLVVRIDQDEVLVDIGYKSEGVIPANELSIRKSVDPHDEVSLGEEVDALVLTKEDQDGRLIISKKRARFEKAWRRIEAAAESGEPVEGSVIEVVKGGLIIDLGVRGFLPASLVDIRRVPNLDEYMGTQIECKVIELNRSRNNVVLSRRAVLEEERKEVRQQILDRLEPGLVVEGQISNIVDFGAFVDLDGIDGLIHISELSWSHVNHPSQVLEIGDTVKVKVLDIDRDRQRISLGLKQTQEDPWQRIVNTYSIGDELVGTVTKVVTFGAFVEILDGVEGLVHISELAVHHVENPREVVQPGDEVRVKILEIDSERRRLSLSAKRVEGQVLPLHPIELSEEDLAAVNDGDEAAAAEYAPPAMPDSEAEAAVATELETESASEPETDTAEESLAAELEAPAGEPEAAADVEAVPQPAPGDDDAPAVQVPAEPADS